MLTLAQLTLLPLLKGAEYLLTHPHEIDPLLRSINPDSVSNVGELLKWASGWSEYGQAYAVVGGSWENLISSGAFAETLFAPTHEGKILSRAVWGGENEGKRREVSSLVEILISPRYRATLRPVIREGLMIHTHKAFPQIPFRPLQVASHPLA